MTTVSGGRGTERSGVPPRPVTAGLDRASLAADLGNAGLRWGSLVLVHASLGAIGWIEGGAGTLLAAMRDVIGSRGTVVAPTFTSWNSDTSRVYESRTRGMTVRERLAYQERLPAFDRDTTPSIECGRFSEAVRTAPGAVRSDHPQTSFAAVGPDAAWLMRTHHLDDHLGERSPLAALYRMDAQVLLLGVGYDKCTAFHLAEYRYIPEPPLTRYGCKINVNGRPVWRNYWDVVLDDRDFAACGAAMEERVPVAKGRVGRAETRCFSLPQAVEFAKIWLRENRLRTDTWDIGV